VAERQHDADLVPVLVDGSGRDGTTLAMQLLATSPQIAFDRVYPYEQRYFNYLLQWSRVAQRESWDGERWNLDNLAHADALRDTDVVGPIPWMERSLIGDPGSGDFWKAAFKAVWGEFSARAREAMRSQLGDPSLAIRYYAQKNAESWDMPASEIPLPEVKIVALLRDPRDVWQSSVAFHNRRKGEGGTFLPIAEGESEDAYLAEFIEQQKKRLGWLQTLQDGEVPVVRYESLIGDLPAEAERLGGWLGLHLDAGAVFLRREVFGEHITAKTPEASVGRWKSEMSDQLAGRFSAAMGAELAEFGYEA
jgi:hypothetical protein